MGELAEQPKFQVFVSGFSSTIEDWRRAMHAPSSELPELNAEQKEIVRKFGITEEDYQRGRLSGLYGHERLRSRGIELGRSVEEILRVLGPEYQLKAVTEELTVRDRWVVRIWTPRKFVNVAIDGALADALIDSNTVQDQERLRILLLTSLERTEFIVDRGQR
jgi:hypothetical protein